jgi:glycosyltransferase involved in cell wall biosynthesis
MNNGDFNPGPSCLIVEPGETGHRREYVTHLMEYIVSSRELHGKYLFVLNIRMKSILGEFAELNQYSIKFIAFDNPPGNIISRSFWEWNLISEIVRETESIREIIFLDIDRHLILLASKKFKKHRLLVKGILFQPYIHFLNGKIRTLKVLRNSCKNYVFQKLAVTFNPNIRKFFILNDKTGVEILNKKLKDIFYFLADPMDFKIDSIDKETSKNFADKYKLLNGKKNLLVFGSIDQRKNLINIIDAISSFPNEVKDKLNLIIAGRFADNTRDRYLNYINKYKGDFNLIYNDDFVIDDERELLFQKSDLILIPYIDFYSSSGVLGLSIIHSKPVVASKFGLVGKIVEENGFGINVDPLNVEEIKSAIYELVFSKSRNIYDNTKFLEEYSPANFSKTLLTS